MDQTIGRVVILSFLKGAARTLNSNRGAKPGRGIRVSMIDDTSLYSKKLLEGMSENGADCILYGPSTPPKTKSKQIMESLSDDTLRIWSPNLLPFQVFRRAAKDRPQVVHFQFEFYGIHSYGPVYSTLALPILLLALRLLGVRTVVTLHSVLPRDNSLRVIRDTSPSSQHIPTILLGSLLLLSYKTIASSANLLIVHAYVFKKRLIEQYRVNPSKIAVIPHGVESWERSRPFIAKDEERDNIVLCFGVISPRKGLESLLCAFGLLLKKRNNCKLLLAGSSPPYYHGYEMRLKALASQLGLGPHVEFLGFVTNDQAHHLFDNAKTIVLPYSYDVSASGALSWALGHALPVIASDNEYFREETSQHLFGLLTSSGNTDDLAQAIETMLAREDLWEVFSRNSREVAHARSWDTVARMTIESYKRLIERS